MSAKSNRGATPVRASAPASPSSALSPLWLYSLIFFATIVAYFPALSAGFIWDDDGHVTRAELRSIGGLVRIWFEPGATQQYYPLLHSAFWLEHALWGDAAGGYHLINILLHATSACLFARLLIRLAVPGAWFAALLFALHPVTVESVAWITEQKNTLSLVFYLAAALAYLRFDVERSRSAYVRATLFFLAALGSKSVTATLPAALLVIFWWQRGRLSWRREVLPLVPWFAAAMVAGITTAWMEHTFIGAQGGDFSLTLVQRLLLAGRAIWFYFGKLVWPAPLIFIYPRWTIDSGEAWQYLFPLGVLALLGGLWVRQRRSRAPLAVALLFIGTLFPALGFINVFPFIFSYVADHFQYHAILAPLALLAAGLTLMLARFPRWAQISAPAFVLVLLGALTWSQTGMYRDLFTLYQTTLEQNPACWMAHNNLGKALVEAGRAPEAIPHFEQTLQLHPNFPEGLNNFGDALTRLGRAPEAIPQLEHALRLQPRYAEAHNNLGAAFMAVGRAVDGFAQFTEATQLNPNYAVARFNLGLALASSGHPSEALTHFAQAVRLQPAYAEAELNWGIALTFIQRFPEAVPHFENALRLQPDNPEVHQNFGRALAMAGRTDDAIAQFEQALQLNPNFADAHYHLALALRQAGRAPEALQHLAEAKRLNPNIR